jgi:hypothetical protein
MSRGSDAALELRRSTINDTLSQRGGCDIAFLTYETPSAECDFLRFRTRGRGTTFIASLLVMGVFYPVNIYGRHVDGTDYSDQIAYLALSIVILAVYIPAVKCAARASMEQQLAAARRHERIVTVSLTVFGAFMTFLVHQRRPVTCVQRFPGSWRTCIFVLEWTIAFMAVVVWIAAPRLPGIVGANTIITVASFAGIATHGLYLPMDYVITFIVLAAFNAVFCMAAMGAERGERAHFGSIVRITAANERIKQFAATVRAVLEAGLPPQLTVAGFSTVAVQRTSSGTVAITEIHNFATWSTRHLVVSVIVILHELVTGYDLLLKQFPDVVRAMTYGDSYIVCCGLLSAVDHHEDSVTAFASAQLRNGTLVASQFEQPFDLRVSICSGPLAGGVVGTTATRYFVVGPALDLARLALAGCAANTIVVSRSEVELGDVAVDAGQHSSVGTPSEESHVHGIDDDVERGADGLTGSDNNDALQFSALWLSFSDPVLQRRMDEAHAAVDSGSRTAAAIPAVVFGSFVVAMLLELTMDHPQRHHDGGIAWGFLAAALLGAGLQLVAQLRGVAQGIAVKTVWTGAVLAMGSVAVLFAGCVFAKPDVGFAFALTLPDLLRGAPWMLQVTVSIVTVIAPSLYWRFAMWPYDSEAEGYSFAFILPVGLTVIRYNVVRASCFRAVAAMLAFDAAARAERRLEEQDALLAGLLPPHAIASAAIPAEDVIAMVEYHRKWQGLSVVQVALRFRHNSDFRPVAKAWRKVAAMIADVGQEQLEMVQAVGDQFLVAGPFDGDADESHHLDAARRVIALVRLLNRGLTKCTFVAVATAGDCSGTLIGAALLGFRLLGPTVRLNDVLLAEAPRPLAGNGAYASETFRRQLTNFGVSLRRSIPFARGGMSMALGPQSVAQSIVGGGDESMMSPKLSDKRDFGEAMQWRVRGGGATMVSAMHLVDPMA